MIGLLRSNYVWLCPFLMYSYVRYARRFGSWLYKLSDHWLFISRCDQSLCFIYTNSPTNVRQTQHLCTKTVTATGVDALRYDPGGRGFDSPSCHWYFSWTQSFRPHYGPGVDSASNRNEYQEYLMRGKGDRCVGLTTLPPSCTRLSWNLVASTSWNPQGLSRPVMGLLYLTVTTRSDSYEALREMDIQLYIYLILLKKLRHNKQRSCLTLWISEEEVRTSSWTTTLTNQTAWYMLV
jgi:hypothetical protein